MAIEKIKLCLFHRVLSPSSQKMILLTSLALIILSNLSLSNVLPLHVAPFVSLVSLIPIIGLTFVYLKAHVVSKAVFSALTVLIALTLSDILPPMGNIESYLTLSLGILGIACASCLYFRKKIEIKKIIDNLIDHQKRYPNQEQHVFLNHSYEYSMLHYELAKRTEGTDNHETWKGILSGLHQKVHIHIEGSSSIFKLDCSLEMARMNKKNIELEVIEITSKDFKQNPEWLLQFSQALQESHNLDCTPDFYIQGCLDEGNKIFVARDKKTHRIFGGLFVRETNDGVFIHSLCKIAAATKIKLTQTVAAFLKKQVYQGWKGLVSCEVHADNVVAQGIYSRLGFKIWKKGTHPCSHFKMRLEVS